jgi:hypothetical protein
MAFDKVISRLTAVLEPVKWEDSVTSRHLELPRSEDYRAFINRCGGGYVCNRYYHFFSLHGPVGDNLLLWNEPAFWHKHFDIDSDWYAVAEDVFGTQFCIMKSGRRPVVKALMPDSGSFSLVANTFEDFVTDIVLGELWRTSQPIATKIFDSFSPVPMLKHISPKVHPLLGGIANGPSDYELCDSAASIALASQIVSQIKHLSP